MLDLIFCLWFSNKCLYRLIKQILFLGIHLYLLPLRISLCRQKQLLSQVMQYPFLSSCYVNRCGQVASFQGASDWNMYRVFGWLTQIVNTRFNGGEYFWNRNFVWSDREIQSFPKGGNLNRSQIPFGYVDNPFLLVNHGWSLRCFAY